MEATGGVVASGQGVEVALRRIVVGVRVVGALWLALLVVVALAGGDLGPLPAAALVALVGGWTAATVVVAARRPAVLRRAPWLAADLAVALVTVLAPLAADAAPSVHGGYPFSTVLLAAWARRLPGGLAAALVLSAAAVARAAVQGLVVVPEAIGSVLVYLVGAAITPWGVEAITRAETAQRRLAAALAEERAQRLRSQERAETAAALHDSVLQTLALLQRRADDPAEVATLARSEERALRAWLVDRHDPRASAGTFAAALAAAAAEVEQRHRVRVEVVTVGDDALDDDLVAVVAAAREALANAAEHAGVGEVACYAEVATEHVEVFVRDRGRGFDPAAVADDRRGLAESVVGRLARRGGRARVDSRPGAGTEVELVLPRPTRPAGSTGPA